MPAVSSFAIVVLAAVLASARSSSSSSSSLTSNNANANLGSTAYPLGCSHRDRSYFDYEHASFPPLGVTVRSPDDYLLLRRLGAGKFSDVFEAVDVNLASEIEQRKRQEEATKVYQSDRHQTYPHPRTVGPKSSSLSTSTSSKPSHIISETIEPKSLVVIKCLKPVSDRKVRRELLVLQHASGLPNLVRLRAVVVPSTSSSKKDSTLSLTPMPSIILEHAGVDSQWLCHPKNYLLTDLEIRYYLYHLLVALDSLHSCGIMHRDVKPRNVLINRLLPKRTARPLTLIDLGLADFYLPDTKYNVRVASRHYKAPELLVGNERYDYAIDLWGFGCVLAGLLMQKEPFFRGKDNLDQLATIVDVLGTRELYEYITKYGIAITPEIRSMMDKASTKTAKSWHTLAEGIFVPPLGLDLLSKLLVYDHRLRLTARQAMAHPFFDPVRERVHQELPALMHILKP